MRFARQDTTRQLPAAFGFEELGNYLADTVLQGIQQNIGAAAFDDFTGRWSG